MRAGVILASRKLATSSGPHSSVVPGIESSYVDIIKVPIDDGVTGKKVAVRSF